MNYYFIDYENVHADGFIGIENLGENDTICVMYTEQSKAFSLELVEKITRQRVKLESYKAGTGAKNSLDFQLASYLGYMIAKSEGTGDCFYIVSRDTGFNHLVDFWAARGASVTRIANFEAKRRLLRRRRLPTSQSPRQNRNQKCLIPTKPQRRSCCNTSQKRSIQTGFLRFSTALRPKWRLIMG